MIDVRINGELQKPSLTNPKHTAALLATAILVAEQMIIEQLLRDAVKHGESHPYAITLKAIINDDACYKNLIKIASQFEANDAGPVMGIQFEYCRPIIEIVRSKLGHQVLAEFAVKLFEAESYTSVFSNQKIVSALTKLTNTGEILQSLNGISVKDQQARGINAGLSLVTQKIAAIKVAQKTTSWCNYFTAAVVPLAVGSAVYASDYYMKQYLKL